MNIKDAIDVAIPEGGMITRISWEQEGEKIFFIPTNTSAGIILYSPLEKSVEHQLVPGWQPEATDLQADDWITY